MQFPAQSQMQRTGGADPRNMIGGSWAVQTPPSQGGMARLPSPAYMNAMGGGNGMGGGMPQPQQVEQPAPMAPQAPQGPSPQMAAIAQALMAQQAPQAPQMPPQMMQGQGMGMNRGQGMGGLRRPVPTRAY